MSPVIVVSKKQYEQIKRNKEWRKASTPLKVTLHKNHKRLFFDKPIQMDGLVLSAKIRAKEIRAEILK